MTLKVCAVYRGESPFSVLRGADDAVKATIAKLGFGFGWREVDESVKNFADIPAYDPAAVTLNSAPEPAN